ncbi:hypothetical protein LCGC14_0660780 [marine sediment metagenome]|uniref:NAD kinase n=1 Tax=marine sediment metagenome TaxID=412755 RepID=A0A0F9U1X3_9ZZZZ|nr:NAD(+)/NADH kinase [Phycisphaerae bacterium]HDZ44606.1 NAD(+)/NADH kinase [Phycisphaerae bacterium]
MARPHVIILGNMAKPGVGQQIDDLLPWFEQRVDVLGVQRADEPCVDDCEKSDLCIVFGGDGTLLYAARTLAHTHVPLLGVNMGKLGFLAEFTVAEMQQHLDTILTGEVKPTERMMLNVHVAGCEHEPFTATAVNDIAIHAGAPFRMIDLNVEQDGGTISRYLGDGLVIATPTGSTAYNMSVGGPIMEPTLDAVAITPVAPHTLALRPIVVRSDQTIHITAVKVNPGSTVIIDGQATTGLCEGDTVDIRRSETPALIISHPGRSFFRTLTDKLQWGRSPHHGGDAT